MNGLTFDRLTRRRSLHAIIAAATAGVAIPHVAAGKGSGKKAKKKCAAQAAQCLNFMVIQCAGNTDCLTSSRNCCPLTGSCDVVGFAECLSSQ